MRGKSIKCGTFLLYGLGQYQNLSRKPGLGKVEPVMNW